MKRCKELLESKKECGRPVMLEPDFNHPSITYYGEKGAVSSVAWPFKKANHGMCFHHANQKRSKEIMDRKELERRTLG
jgi:hypothetical protein